MQATHSSFLSVLDVIAQIRKVGNFNDPDAEIFLVLLEHGEYSFDRFVFPYFEDFWLNAKPGSTVSVMLDAGGTVQNMRLVRR